MKARTPACAPGRDGVVVSDEIALSYQTALWASRPQFRFPAIGQTNAMATIEVQALDGNGVL